MKLSSISCLLFLALITATPQTSSAIPVSYSIQAKAYISELDQYENISGTMIMNSESVLTYASNSPIPGYTRYDWIVNSISLNSTNLLFLTD